MFICASLRYLRLPSICSLFPSVYIHRELFLLCFLLFLLMLFISCACVARSPSLSCFLSLSGYLCESSAPFLQSHLRIWVRLCVTSAFVYMSLCVISNEIVYCMSKVCCIINCILDVFSAHSHRMLSCSHLFLSLKGCHVTGCCVGG